jgi:uncharacterized protein (DUF1778 family)
MAAVPTRTRTDRIEFRTTPATRQLVDQAVAASGTNLTDFAEQSLLTAAQRVLADREQFLLTAEQAAAWDAINEGPARELPGLRALLDRPSPFRG